MKESLRGYFLTFFMHINIYFVNIIISCCTRIKREEGIILEEILDRLYDQYGLRSNI